MNPAQSGAAPANPYFGTLSAVSPAELPAKSAALVAKADAKNRAESTVNVVKAAVGLNPAAAAAIVGTIAQSAPEMASVAAGAAVALVPDQAVAIAHAAAAAAPSEAGKIVEAVCRLVPNQFQASHGRMDLSTKAILAGVSKAIPELKEPINKALAVSTSDNPSVSDVMNSVKPIDIAVGNLPQSDGASMKPLFHVGPPYIPPPPTPITVSPNPGGTVPIGGRNYASP